MSPAARYATQQSCSLFCSRLQNSRLLVVVVCSHPVSKAPAGMLNSQAAVGGGTGSLLSNVSKSGSAQASRYSEKGTGEWATNGSFYL